MKPRWKKLIGLAILLPGLAVYLMAAALLGERVPNQALFKVIYYFVAGVAWAFPVRCLMRWASADPSQNGA